MSRAASEAITVAAEFRELDAARGCQGPQRRRQESGIEFGARVSAPERVHALLSGGWIFPGEEPMYGLIRGDRAESDILS